MRKEIIKSVIIPEGVKLEVNGRKLIVKGKFGESEREFRGNFNMEKKGNEIIFSNKKSTKKEKKMINTSEAHIKNMIYGVEKKFEYKLKAVSAHFPMSLSIEKNYLIIKNFLGESESRKAKILEGVEIKIEKDNIIEIISNDKERAGQTAANIENSTKIKSRDRRVFQDGIFITRKPGDEE